MPVAPVITIPDPVEAQTREIFGKRRIPPFDRFHEPLGFYQRQLETNLDMLQRKGRLFRDLIRSNEFDLLVNGINLHDVVHELWPFQEGRNDPRDPEGRLAHGVRLFTKRPTGRSAKFKSFCPPGPRKCCFPCTESRTNSPPRNSVPGSWNFWGIMCLLPQRAFLEPSGYSRRVLPEPWRFKLSQVLSDRWQQTLLRSAFAQSMDFRRSRAFVLPTSLFSTNIRVNLKRARAHRMRGTRRRLRKSAQRDRN